VTFVLLEDRHRSRCLVQHLLVPAFGGGEEADEELGQAGVRPERCVAGRRGGGNRLLEDRIRSVEVADVGERRAEVGQELEPPLVSGAKIAAARSSRFVAAAMSPRPNARRPAEARRCPARWPSSRPWSSSGPSSER
jgi:hypothetical protein